MYGSACKIIRDSKNNTNILTGILRKDGTPTTTNRDTREEILRYNFPYEPLEDYMCFNNNRDSEYIKPITKSKLDTVTRDLKTKKASGPNRIDGILSK